MLSNEQKIQVITTIIDRLKSTKQGGICIKGIVTIHNLGLTENSETNLFYYIPEFLKYKPVNNSGAYWFPQRKYEYRIKICESVIKELQQQQQNNDYINLPYKTTFETGRLKHEK